MKANPWLLPGVALLITGGWIVSGKRSAAVLEHEIDLLAERIRLVQAAGNDTSKSGAAGMESRKDQDGKINWKDLAGKLNEMSGGGTGHMGTMMRVHRLLSEMSVEELCARLDEIAALDLDDVARGQALGMVLAHLAEKDPKMVIERFGDEVGDENSASWGGVYAAFQYGAHKEPAAMAAWLDKQIAAGKFDSKSINGKNDALIRCESVLVGHLLKTDPAAASARVAALPENQREEFFKFVSHFPPKPEGESAYVKLVRDNLPAGNVVPILANTACNLAKQTQQGGYERVDAFIAAAKATDVEKEAIVQRVIESRMLARGEMRITAEVMDETRAWVAGQSPGAVDKATGEALAIMLRQGGDSIKDVSALALQYHASSGNDEVLAALLKSQWLGNNEAGQVSPLIEQIKDPALREEIRALPVFRKK